MRYRGYCIFGEKLTTYYDLCQLHLFCDIFQLQYIGTVTYDIHRLLHDIYLHDIYLALSRLKLFLKLTGSLFPLHPMFYINDLLHSSSFFPQMPYLCRSALSLFYNALSVEL